jgi:hypothetical protein
VEGFGVVFAVEEEAGVFAHFLFFFSFSFFLFFFFGGWRFDLVFLFLGVVGEGGYW